MPPFAGHHFGDRYFADRHFSLVVFRWSLIAGVSRRPVDWLIMYTPNFFGAPLSNL
jgi:hypothetical protein